MTEEYVCELLKTNVRSLFKNQGPANDNNEEGLRLWCVYIAAHSLPQNPLAIAQSGLGTELPILKCLSAALFSLRPLFIGFVGIKEQSEMLLPSVIIPRKRLVDLMAELP
jgi:hypothetical protein